MNEMTPPMRAIAEQIGQWLGIVISPSQYQTMMSGMQRVAMELGWGNDPHLWVSKLRSNPEAETLRVLAKHITIGETYFFREESSVNFVRQIVAHEVERHINQTNRPYRIWTAACSTGEEPYSLVMLLLEALPKLSPKNLEVLATDVNPEALSKARVGIYRDWSFRTTPAAIRTKYFTRETNHWVISEQVRKFVRFQLHNLISDPYPCSSNGEHFQLIFCRNVFIYFDFPTIKSIARRFFDCLLPGGWLVTSQVELHDELYVQYVRIAHNNGFFYRKPLSHVADDTSQSKNKLQQSNLRLLTTRQAERKLLTEYSKPAELNIPQTRTSQTKTENKSSEQNPQPITTKQEQYELSAYQSKVPIQPMTTAEELVNQALQFLEHDQTDLALGRFQQALYLSPDNLEARFQLAHLLHKLNQTEESNKQYRILLRQLRTMPPGEPVFGGLSAEALIAICNLALNRHD